MKTSYYILPPLFHAPPDAISHCTVVHSSFGTPAYQFHYLGLPDSMNTGVEIIAPPGTTWKSATFFRQNSKIRAIYTKYMETAIMMTYFDEQGEIEFDHFLLRGRFVDRSEFFIQIDDLARELF